MGSMFRGLCLLGRNPGNHQAHKATSWLDKRPGKLLDTPLVEEEIGCMADLAQELCQGLSTRTCGHVQESRHLDWARCLLVSAATSCYRLNVHVPPGFMCGSCSLQCDSIWGWGLWEVIEFG